MQTLIKQTLAFTWQAVLFINCASAQTTPQLRTSLTWVHGNYQDATLLKQQQGAGIRNDFENVTWGATWGLQRTYIDMQPLTQVPQQKQDNWLLSAYTQTNSTYLPGAFKVRLDAHSLQTGSSNMRSLAPEITWTSFDLPMQLHASMAISNYSDMADVHQYSGAINWGLNAQQDWVELRGYWIRNLDPQRAEQRSQTMSPQIRWTHLISSQTPWIPHSLSLTLDGGEKIYHIDMVTQSVYNLPMLSKGGQSLALKWSLSSRSQFSVQLSKTHYDASTGAGLNHFTLNNVSAQSAFNW